MQAFPRIVVIGGGGPQQRSIAVGRENGVEHQRDLKEIVLAPFRCEEGLDDAVNGNDGGVVADDDEDEVDDDDDDTSSTDASSAAFLLSLSSSSWDEDVMTMTDSYTLGELSSMVSRA